MNLHDIPDDFPQDKVAELVISHKDQALQAEHYGDKLAHTEALAILAKLLDPSDLYSIDLDAEGVALIDVLDGDTQRALFDNIFAAPETINVLENSFEPKHRRPLSVLRTIYHTFSPCLQFSKEFTDELWQGLPDLTQTEAYQNWPNMSDREKMTHVSNVIDEFRVEKIDTLFNAMGIESISDVTGIILAPKNRPEDSGKTRGCYEDGFVYLGAETDDPAVKKNYKFLLDESHYNEQGGIVTPNGYAITMYNFDNPDELNKVMRHELAHMVVDNLLSTRSLNDFTMGIGYEFSDSDYVLALASNTVGASTYSTYRNNAEEVLARQVSFVYQENVNVRELAFLDDVKLALSIFGMSMNDILSMQDLGKIMDDPDFYDASGPSDKPATDETPGHKLQGPA